MVRKCDYPVHYRYRDSVVYDSVVIIEERFYPIRETKCFYWVLGSFDYGLYKSGCAHNVQRFAKKVSKKGIRRRCYPSREVAMESFLIRKRRQIKHAERALKQAEMVIRALPRVDEFKDQSMGDWAEMKVGGKEFVRESFVFD